jgi:hypothetical protein
MQPFSWLNELLNKFKSIIMVINVFKKRLVCWLAALAAISLLSFTILWQQANFSGTWNLNIAHSQFGKTPQYAAVKKWTFFQSSKEIRVRWIVVDEAGNETEKTEEITLDGKVNTSISQPGDVTRKTGGEFSSDGKVLLTKTDYSKPGEPDQIHYTISKEFKLAPSQKQLTLKMTTPAYVLLLVYDKQ